MKKLKGKVKHFFHLGAVYDIEASAEQARKMINRPKISTARGD